MNSEKENAELTRKKTVGRVISSRKEREQNGILIGLTGKKES